MYRGASSRRRSCCFVRCSPCNMQIISHRLVDLSYPLNHLQLSFATIDESRTLMSIGYSRCYLQLRVASDWRTSLRWGIHMFQMISCFSLIEECQWWKTSNYFMGVFWFLLTLFFTKCIPLKSLCKEGLCSIHLLSCSMFRLVCFRTGAVNRVTYLMDLFPSSLFLWSRYESIRVRYLLFLLSQLFRDHFFWWVL